MCICIYAWKRQVVCIHSLYTHQYIYIYMYMHGVDKSLAFSFYTYMCIYMSAIYGCTGILQSDYRWNFGSDKSLNCILSLSLHTSINIYIYVYMRICIYAWKRQVACIHSLYTHQYIYIHVYGYAWRRPVTCILSLYTHIHIYIVCL